VAALLVVCLAAALVGAVITRVGRGPRPALASSGRIACGVERWAVKTLTDPGARLVNFRPRPTTVSTLRRLRPTGTYARGKGVERRTYRVRARLVESRLEDDQDFHLVIVDLRYPSRTMIVEFPDPACTRHAVQKRRLQMQSARSRFINACGFPSSSSFDRLRGTASIIGVGFFDFIHGQAGVAPNGIELHPVLSFTKARCS